MLLSPGGDQTNRKGMSDEGLLPAYSSIAGAWVLDLSRPVLLFCVVFVVVYTQLFIRVYDSSSQCVLCVFSLLCSISLACLFLVSVLVC